MLSTQAVLSSEAARSSSAAAGPSRRPGTPLVVPLPQMITLKDVFIAPSGKNPVAGEFHVTSGTIASRRESIAAVASWIPPP